MFGAVLKEKITDMKVGAVISDLLGDLSYAWLFMLAVGIARAHWLPTLPTIGFTTALLLTVMLRTAHGYWSAKTAERVIKSLGLVR